MIDDRLMRRHRYVCGLMACCLSFSLYGQIEEIRLELDNIDVNDGLSHNVITALYEDDYGFIWVGTSDGLNRLDGYNIEVFREEFYNNPNCNGNRIYRIGSNAPEELWISKDEGAYRYDLKADSLVDYSMAQSAKPRRYTGTLYDGSKVLTNNAAQIIKIDSISRRVDTIKVVYPLYEEDYRPYTMDANLISDRHVALINNVGGVMIYDFEKNKFEYHLPPKNYGKDFAQTCVDGLSRVWTSSAQGIVLCLDPKTGKYEDKTAEMSIDDDILFLYHDEHEEQIWISTRSKGLYTYDYTSDTWQHYNIRVKGERAIQSETIASMIRDSHGVLWLGTLVHGVLTYDVRATKFNSLRSRDYGIDINMLYPRAIAEDEDGYLWIGTSSRGLWKYDDKNNILEVYTHESHPEIMPNNSATCLVIDGDRLYIGHNREGVSVVSRKRMRLIERKTYHSQNRAITDNNTVRSLYKDPLGRLWVGTIFAGLFIDDGASVKHLFQDDIFQPPNRDIYGITALNDGTVVINNRIGGLYRWDEAERQIIQVYPKDDALEISIKTVYQDIDGLIWVATEGKGLHVLDEHFDLHKIITTDDGIIGSNVVTAMIEDGQDHLWISSNNGLTRMDKDTTFLDGTHQIFTVVDGLQSNEFMTGLALKSDDRMWIGTINGLNYWDNNSMTSNDAPVHTYISGIELGNSPYTPEGNIYNLSEVELAPNDNTISINYNTIGYTFPQRTQYQYRMLGIDDTWSLPSNRTFASFSNLEPKEYTFEVKASNYDGVWSNNVKRLKINVLPKFSETIWFKLLIGLLLAGILYLINRYTVEQARQKEEVKSRYLKEISSMEMRALKAQINPHFLFNTLNSINNYILQNEGDVASNYLVKFSKLMRRVLTNSANSLITLTDEVDTLGLYIELESMRFAQSFDYFINVDKGLDTNKLMVPPMLIQPFVENAIWHGLMHSTEEKCLEINISKKDDRSIAISVKDNGIGREAAKSRKANGAKQKSYGMDITQKRIELLNNEYKDERSQSSVEIIDWLPESHGAYGTEVIIRIPAINQSAQT